MSILGRLYYRVEEVAEILKISVRTAYRAIESDQIPSTKIRGCIRVPIGEFHAMFGQFAAGGMLSTSTSQYSTVNVSSSQSNPTA